MFSILEVVGRLLGPIDIVDVGAMWLAHDTLSYRALLRGGVSRVVGFEPVQAECDKLNAMGMAGHRYLPHYIGDGTERTFHLTSQTMCSSLYEPNTPLLSAFGPLEGMVRTVETSTVRTRRLDDIAEVKAIDYMKVDVQGAELDVLGGATRLLRGTVVVEAEVEFEPLYKGQPLFGDIDRFMREQSFRFHTFTGLSGGPFAPVESVSDPALRPKQVLWSNAVYVKDFLALESLTGEQLLKMAVILHEVYASFDLAYLALAAYDGKTRGGLSPVYRRRLAAGGGMKFAL